MQTQKESTIQLMAVCENPYVGLFNQLIVEARTDRRHSRALYGVVSDIANNFGEVICLANNVGITCSSGAISSENAVELLQKIFEIYPQTEEEIKTRFKTRFPQIPLDCNLVPQELYCK